MTPNLALLPVLALVVAVQTPAVARPATLAIQNVTVVPATGGASIPASTVVIREDRIVAIGPANEVAVPPGSRTVDGSGQFLMPGLIDMHTHLSKSRVSALGLFIASGVMTVRDMGGDAEELFEWRSEVALGKRIGPRILMAGPILESTANIERMRKDPPADRVEPFERVRIGVGSPAQARTTVSRLAGLGIDFLKIRTVQDRETYLALNEAATTHGLLLVGHAPALSAKVIPESGQDGIEHGFPRPFDKETREERLEVWRRFAAAGVSIVPTLVQNEAILAPLDHLRALLGDSGNEIEPRRRYLSKYLMLDWREQVAELTPEYQQRVRRGWDQRLRDMREMHEAGMEVLAGTDIGVVNIYPGQSLHEELALFVRELDMTPAEAIERATRRSARFLRIADSVGTIERGKIADLILLDGDPTLDISNTRRIAGVVMRGEFHDRRDLDCIRAEVLDASDLRADDWGRTSGRK